jgi:hypothetical protein
VYEFHDKASIVKIKILFDIRSPIREGMFIGNHVDGINWVHFRFENLQCFVFYADWWGIILGTVGRN